MVIALDKHKKPIGFVTEKRARKLMESHRACIYRTYPTVIIIKDLEVILILGHVIVGGRRGQWACIPVHHRRGMQGPGQGPCSCCPWG